MEVLEDEDIVKKVYDIHNEVDPFLDTGQKVFYLMNHK